MERTRWFSEVKFVVRAIIQNEDEEVLILIRPDGTYCLPGGKMEVEDENDPLKALEREVEEETGLKVVTSKLFKTEEDYTGYTYWHNGYFVVTVQTCSDIVLGSEEKGYKWINQQELSSYQFSYNNDNLIKGFFES